MKFSGRFKSRLEANVGIGGCVSPIGPTANPEGSLSVLEFKRNDRQVW